MSMIDPQLQIENDEEDGAFSGQLSAVAPDDATPVPDNDAGDVARDDRPLALQGVALPGRDRSVRRAVLKMYEENGHLPASARHAVANRCRLERVIERAYTRMLKNDLQPSRDMDLFMKALGEARQHDRDLGLTPVSMASLGISLGHLRRIVGEDGNQAVPEDVKELESRLLANLQGQRDE